ncbi:ImmA/IrrE family metallo-endopeptidase [Gemmatimonas aurantiaca]|uniref:ImmA/IrrE family metallo-endopeptidase n=1 Tax=Gemmatimonas aurantiaca TaxID=173480 RepID=UPI00301DEFD8
MAEFAKRVELPVDDVSALLEGRLAISLGLARRLESEIGASVAFWLARDNDYQQDAARRAGRTPRDERWLAELPIADMLRFGWITPRPAAGEEMDACLQFFGVPDVESWQEHYAPVVSQAAYRTSLSFDARPASVAAWLRQGERVAAGIPCGSWNPEGFRAVLQEVRALTRIKEPARFIPRLQELCAAHGVAVVIARAPSGCRASGATMWVAPDKALLLLSMRFLTDDHFWFTFFHEAAHLLLHRNRELILEGVGESVDDDEEANLFETHIEEEANRFAAETLIPLEHEAVFKRLGQDAIRVIRFATQIGIAPGIVVGQLHFRGLVQRNRLNKLRRRYLWTE